MNTFDPVDADIRRYTHEQGMEALEEMRVEQENIEVYEDYLDGGYDDIAEKTLIYFMESIEPEKDTFRKLLKAKGDQEILEVAKELIDDLNQYVDHLSFEEALENLKNNQEEI